MEDPNPRMRVQALRVSETIYKAGDKSFADTYRRAARDADALGRRAVRNLRAVSISGPKRRTSRAR
jgi:hypothetical protein